MPGKLNGLSGAAKLAITGAAGLLLSAGLCGIGSKVESRQEFGGPITGWGFVGFIVSFVFLLVAAVWAVIAFIRRRTGGSDAQDVPVHTSPTDKEGDE